MPRKRQFQDLWNDQEPTRSDQSRQQSISSKRQKLNEIQTSKTEVRISSGNPVQVIKQNAFQPLIVPTLKKLKKKSKSEKKYCELQKMLEQSDKFFKEVKTPAQSDEHTLNNINVLMEDHGLCSVGNVHQKFLSWPDYCRTHRFISKLSGPVPDIIVPTNFPGVEKIADQRMKLKKGKQYLLEGGMIKLNQKKNIYHHIEDEKDDESTFSEGNKIMSRHGQDDLSESMDEDEEPSTYDQLFDSSGNQKEFIQPVIFDPKKKKDKTLKCRKCCKGGHLDVHCPLQVEDKWSCHVCQTESLDHDSFTCPFLNERCRQCHQAGHTESTCRLGSLHIEMLKQKAWQMIYMPREMPTFEYNRVIHTDEILEFNYDRITNTNLRKLLQCCQEQEWLYLKSDDTIARMQFFQRTYQMIKSDYEERQKKKGLKKFKPSDDDVDMENPPIPDYHSFLKLYCPECTKPHSIQFCDKIWKNGRGKSNGILKDTDWASEQNPAFLKGKARRMAKFRYLDRNSTRLGSYSKDKTKIQEKRNESKTRRNEMQQEHEKKLLENQKNKELQNSLQQLQKFQAAPSMAHFDQMIQYDANDNFDPWGQPKLPNDDQDWPAQRKTQIYEDPFQKMNGLNNRKNSIEWFKDLKHKNKQQNQPSNIDQLSFLLQKSFDDQGNLSTRGNSKQ